MMKYLFCILLSFFFIGCSNDEYKETIVKDIAGEWVIFNDNIIQGEIIFTTDEEFVMNTPLGSVIEGNYSLSPDKDNLSIVYAIDQFGDDLITDEDYDNGWYCKLVFKSTDEITINNLPFYRNKTVELKRK